MPSLDRPERSAVENVPGKASAAGVFKGARMTGAAIFRNVVARAGSDDRMKRFDGLDH
jgi:hypothetical protein